VEYSEHTLKETQTRHAQYKESAAAPTPPMHTSRTRTLTQAAASAATAMGPLETPENTIAMLLSVIAENSLPLAALNMLMRTSKTLNTAATDPRLLDRVLQNTPMMTKKAIRRLFVLPARVPLRFIVQPCPHRGLRVIPRCSVARAFRTALVQHESVQRMKQAFHARARRSLCMKRMWQRKREEREARCIERRREIVQIHDDLAMIPQRAHTTTDAEVYYSAFGVIKRLSSVYTGKRLMILRNAGLLDMPENTFVQVANLDRTYPHLLTHAQRLYVLRHNIAWEHYLYNYTNFEELLHSVEHVLNDINHVEFLFPLPLRWPWIAPAAAPFSAHFDAADIHELYEGWHAEHEGLYAAGPQL